MTSKTKFLREAVATTVIFTGLTLPALRMEAQTAKVNQQAITNVQEQSKNNESKLNLIIGGLIVGYVLRKSSKRRQDN